MDKEAPDWGVDAVFRRLEARTPSPRTPVEAQLFLEESVAPEDVGQVVDSAVRAAAAETGVPQSSITLGRARSLSRSIAVTAPLEVLRLLMARKEFTSLLPADLTSDEAMIKPVEREE